MPPKLNQIQGIRALAMLGIFIAHTSIWLTDDLGWFAPIASQLGGSGVVTFFMLSGFLLAYKKKQIPNTKKANVIRMAWAKTGKLYSLYLITILVSFVAKFPQTIQDWMKTLVSVPLHLTMLQAFVPFPSIINALNGPAWFLSAFFGIWLIVYRFPTTINKLLSTSAVGCVKALVFLIIAQCIWLSVVKYGVMPVLMTNRYFQNSYDWLVYNNPIICLSEFCFGILIERICVLKSLSVKVQNYLAIGVFGIAVLYMFLLAVRADIILPWMVIIECIVGAGVLVVISTETWGARFLSGRVLVWFGNVSGYFFLIHGAVNYSLRTFVADYIPKPWMFFIAFAISCFMSFGSDYFYTTQRNTIVKTNNENC